MTLLSQGGQFGHGAAFLTLSWTLSWPVHLAPAFPTGDLDQYFNTSNNLGSLRSAQRRLCWNQANHHLNKILNCNVLYANCCMLLSSKISPRNIWFHPTYIFVIFQLIKPLIDGNLCYASYELNSYELFFFIC